MLRICVLVCVLTASGCAARILYVETNHNTVVAKLDKPSDHRYALVSASEGAINNGSHRGNGWLAFELPDLRERAKPPDGTLYIVDRNNGRPVAYVGRSASDAFSFENGAWVGYAKCAQAMQAFRGKQTPEGGDRAVSACTGLENFSAISKAVRTYVASDGKVRSRTQSRDDAGRAATKAEADLAQTQKGLTTTLRRLAESTAFRGGTCVRPAQAALPRELALACAPSDATEFAVAMCLAKAGGSEVCDKAAEELGSSLGYETRSFLRTPACEALVAKLSGERYSLEDALADGFFAAMGEAGRNASKESGFFTQVFGAALQLGSAAWAVVRFDECVSGARRQCSSSYSDWTSRVDRVRRAPDEALGACRTDVASRDHSRVDEARLIEAVRDGRSRRTRAESELTAAREELKRASAAAVTALAGFPAATTLKRATSGAAPSYMGRAKDYRL